MNLITAVYTAMFNPGKGYVKRKNGDIHLLGRTKGGLRRTTIGRFLYIEQNPKKDSKWAELSRQGERIMWVIDTETRKYVGRVHDGEITRIEHVEAF